MFMHEILEFGRVIVADHDGQDGHDCVPVHRKRNHEDEDEGHSNHSYGHRNHSAVKKNNE